MAGAQRLVCWLCCGSTSSALFQLLQSGRDCTVWQTFSQFTCSFPNRKQIRIVKGEKDSDYLFPNNIDPKYPGEKLSVIKGESGT